MPLCIIKNHARARPAARPGQVDGSRSASVYYNPRYIAMYKPRRPPAEVRAAKIEAGKVAAAKKAARAAKAEAARTLARDRFFRKLAREDRAAAKQEARMKRVNARIAKRAAGELQWQDAAYDRFRRKVARQDRKLRKDQQND
jgi:hypothetical protein